MVDCALSCYYQQRSEWSCHYSVVVIVRLLSITHQLRHMRIDSHLERLLCLFMGSNNSLLFSQSIACLLRLQLCFSQLNFRLRNQFVGDVQFSFAFIKLCLLNQSIGEKGLLSNSLFSVLSLSRSLSFSFLLAFFHSPAFTASLQPTQPFPSPSTQARLPDSPTFPNVCAFGAVNSVHVQQTISTTTT